MIWMDSFCDLRECYATPMPYIPHIYGLPISNPSLLQTTIHVHNWGPSSSDFALEPGWDDMYLHIYEPVLFSNKIIHPAGYEGDWDTGNSCPRKFIGFYVISLELHVPDFTSEIVVASVCTTGFACVIRYLLWNFRRKSGA
ncbi:MAG: hypothetical protein RBG13Loki_2681 [Promethearchaeota archaeon CR_4]|nr:MAG: hypothetical protein RBG13Loki_2681 [Candidatus Lokiarchaeota archaeon CR_4]